MEVKTMSVSEGYVKDYGELFEYEETSIIIERNGVPNSNRHSIIPINSPSQFTDSSPSTRCSSDISMDLSDLLLEDGATSRLVSGSLFPSNALSNGPASPWRHLKQKMNHMNSVQEDDESFNDGGDDEDEDEDNDDDSEYSNDWNNCHDGNSNIMKFNDFPEEFLPLSDFCSFYTHSSPIETKRCHRENEQQTSSTVDEQETSKSSISMSMSSLVTSHGSLSRSLFNSSTSSTITQRKVKFEISTRLEVIQEYEKPGIEDYHRLYYTAHELQKMIDDQRAEERK